MFMEDSKHFLSLQALHWFLWVLSMGHLPLKSPWALHVYTRLRWMLRLKNPEHPAKKKTVGMKAGINTWGAVFYELQNVIGTGERDAKNGPLEATALLHSCQST